MLRGSLGRFPFSRLARLTTVPILCHRHADVDAYCAAYALRGLLRQLRPGLSVPIVAPEGLGALARKVEQQFPAPVSEGADLGLAQLVFIVDTGHAALLGELQRTLAATKARRVFIDHHPLTSSIRGLADVLVSDKSASSASELVFRLFVAKRVPLSRRLAQALLTGILFDSQHLSIARHGTLAAVVAICKKGASIVAAKRLLHTPRDRSEVIARLKAAQRLQGYQCGPWIIATASVGSFQASAARGLLDLGADVAIVVGSHEGQTRCSLRSTQHFARTTRMHLGSDVAEHLARREADAAGGGHPTAASLTSRAAPGEVRSAVLARMAEMLGAKAIPLA
jgi:nanoRNase/pAp phosphatase (c-di-AMP/oligoRNAs hydrolase)